MRIKRGTRRRAVAAVAKASFASAYFCCLKRAFTEKDPHLVSVGHELPNGRYELECLVHFVLFQEEGREPQRAEGDDEANE